MVRQHGLQRLELDGRHGDERHERGERERADDGVASGKEPERDARERGVRERVADQRVPANHEEYPDRRAKDGDEERDREGVLHDMRAAMKKDGLSPISKIDYDSVENGSISLDKADLYSYFTASLEANCKIEEYHGE